jgi:cell wall-associated NlpC family hydrolase
LESQENQITAYCQVSVAYLKAAADHNAPLLSQVLFGEQVFLLRKIGRHWMKVQCSWDRVEGWVDPKQFHINDKHPQFDKFTPRTFALDHMHPIISEKASIPIIIGSNLLQCDGLNVKMPFGKYQYTGQIIDLEQSLESRKLLINVARRFLQTPYLMGGRSILGTDSTGFIQLAYKLIGINLPRRADEMVLLGTDVGFVNEAREGDIAFYEDKHSQIVHTGIVLEDSKVLHTYGKVRIDHLDQQGIYIKRRRSYIYKLRTIRRYFNN